MLSKPLSFAPSGALEGDGHHAHVGRTHASVWLRLNFRVFPEASAPPPRVLERMSRSRFVGHQRASERALRSGLRVTRFSVRKRSSPTIPSGVRGLAPPARRKARSKASLGKRRYTLEHVRGLHQHRRASTSPRGGRGSLTGLALESVTNLLRQALSRLWPTGFGPAAGVAARRSAPVERRARTGRPRSGSPNGRFGIRRRSGTPESASAS